MATLLTMAQGPVATNAPDQQEWAYLTAWNPGSRILKQAENELRQMALEGVVTALGYTYFPGWGIGPGETHRERSCLVLHISLEKAIDLARVFGQNAIIAGEGGGKAKVVWAAHARSRSRREHAKPQKTRRKARA